MILTMASIGTSWKKFSALIPATALTFLDQTILPVALPTIQQEMTATDTQLQWCVNSFLLAIAVFVLISGKLGDMIGHKKLLIWGVLGFTISSILCGLSHTVSFLIAARALQGISAALMFPAQFAIIAQTFPVQTRGKAMGMLASIGSLFLILGPLVGGYLLEVASWEWLFWINVPTGAVGIWMIYAFLPQSEPGKNRIDLLGFLYFTIGISSLTLVLMQAVDWGWTSTRTIAFSLLGVAGLFLLFIREKRASHPFLDLPLFKHPVFAATNLSIAIIQFFLMIIVFRTIYFQEVLGYTPFLTGFVMFIGTIPVLFMSPIAGHLSDRMNPRVPIALGYLLLIFSCFWFGFSSTPSFTAVMIILILFGCGFPFIFTPSYSSALSSVPKAKTGTASGIITTLRMTGGSVGLALIHLFVTTVQQQHRSEGARLAKITSFSYVHFALAFLLTIVFAMIFILHSRKSAHRLPQAPAEGWD